MATKTYMSTMYLELRNRVGEDKHLADGITDNILLNKETTFNLLQDIYPGCKVSATDISLDMKMYESDHVTVKLSLKNTEGVSMAHLSKVLMGLRASIKCTSSTGIDQELSKNLFVYRAIPSIEQSGTNSTLSVQLELYSADKLLDLQKFSQAYTGLPLGKILTNETLDAYVPKNNGADMYELTTSKNLQVLKCTIGKDTNREVIQPYLAQYNETFRSMLNRTANRCGEFLYWHNGQLQYGLHSDTSIDISKDADSVTLSTVPDFKFETLDIKETHRNGGDDPDFSSNGTINYDLETGMPDFNNTVKFVYGSGRKYDAEIMYGSTFGLKYKTNPDISGYGSIDWKKSNFKKFLFGNFLSNYAKTSNFWDFLSDTVADILVNKPLDNLNSSEKQDDDNQKISHKRLLSDKDGDKFGFVNDEQTNFASDLDANNKYSKKANGVKGYDELENRLKISPFSTLKEVITNSTDLLDKAPLNNAFYSKVRTLGKNSALNAIDITLRSNAVTLNVGQRITVNGIQYLITSITGSCNSDNSFKFASSIHAIPEQTVGENKYFVPEPLPEQNRKMDGNSTAIITDAEDPYGEGRVRVRFTWQGRHPVGLSGDDKKECFEKALSDVYSEGNTEAKRKAYDNDRFSYLLAYKDGFIKEILEAKKNDPNIKAEDKKKVNSKDKVGVYSVNDSLYPKSIALIKANELSTEDKKVVPLFVREVTFKDITDTETRHRKVDEKALKYEQEKLKSLEDNENKKDSTPWIRMASPMAGKASLYLQPSEDDEVIVGFENGNPERPYVLGALFNGDNGAPGGHGLTMENGHGIQLENENMSVADLISTLISPMTKSILSLADKDEKWDIDDPNKLKVGGKVSIKDKYGFYSLSMSSADREVNIKCPLGNVSISAFTGISISAPNGDINIKGKNVTISAGDKLTLKSGTNKDMLETGVEDFTGMLKNAITNSLNALADNMFGSIKMIDLSLARSVWEVIFRPVNGTMTIKSKRHMCLEAGNGSVEMPVDTLKAKDPSSATEQIPNYPYYILQDFMTNLNSEVKNRLSALQVAYDTVLSCKTRENNDKFDLDANRPAKTAAYTSEYGTHKENMKTILSEKKMSQILHDCVTAEGEIIETKLSEYCPYPVGTEYKVDNDCWDVLVKETAQKVANLRKIYQTIVKTELKNTPATKSLIEAMPKIKPEDFGVTSAFINTVKYTEVGNPSAAEQVFKAEDFDASDKLKPIIISGAFGTDELRNVQLGIITVLHKHKKLAIIRHDDPIQTDKKKYHLCETVPSLSQIIGSPEWIDWNNFIKHCVPADSVIDIDSHYNWAAIGEAALDFLKDTGKNMIDSDNLDVRNWFTAKESHVWDAKSNPGTILMSSENGSTTAIVGKDGKITSNDNHSLKALLSNMATKSTEVASITAIHNTATKIEDSWTKDITI